MAAETIRSFLVALGFKIDQPTLKKFEDVITASTLKANLLAGAFVGMAKSLAESLQDATRDLNNLYYTSVRVGSSATNLKALTQASQDFGVSSEEALGNIEALAKELRTDPSKESLINFLGVQTRDANHQLRDTVDIANDLGKALANQPDFMVNKFSQLLDLTYKFQTMIRDPGWLADLEKHQKLLASGDYEDAARGAAQLEQQLRGLQDRWDALKTRVESHLFKRLNQDFEDLGKWIDAHGPEIDAFVDGFATTVETAAKIVVPLLGTIAEGWRLIFAEVKRLGEYVAGGTSQDWMDRLFPTSPINPKVFSWLIEKLGIKGPVDEALGLTGGQSAGGAGAFGIRNNNPGNLEYRGQMGAVKAGGSPFEQRFAAWRTPQEGLAAMARQIELDFGRGRTNLESLLGKYAPPGENDTGAYIADVAGQLHVGASEALNLSDPAMLSNLMNAMIRHEDKVNPYRPEDVRAAAQGAIEQQVTLNQTNHFTINGAQDPSKVKQAVADALQDSNRRMTRNLQGAAR